MIQYNQINSIEYQILKSQKNPINKKNQQNGT